MFTGVGSTRRNALRPTPSPLLGVFAVRSDRRPRVDIVHLEVEGDGPRRKPDAVGPAVRGALEVPVVDEQAPQCHVIRADRGRDVAIPVLQRRIDLAFGIGPIALEEHHDALHQDLAVPRFPREPARSTIRAEAAQPLHELLG